MNLTIAATADLHFGEDSGGRLSPYLELVEGAADLLLLAGDLTRTGDPGQAAVLADELRGLRVPVFAVLGNHDHHLGRAAEVAAVMEAAGVEVLEGSGAVVEAAGVRLGVAGVKGFGGGFAGACGTEFGEPQMKAFVSHGRERAECLAAALASLAGRCDALVALTHYSPVRGTLVGEPLELYPFLGSHLLGEVIDAAGVRVALHGHAHAGSERGSTPGGVPVRNVAQAVTGRPFTLLSLATGAAPEAWPRAAAGGAPEEP